MMKKFIQKSLLILSKIALFVTVGFGQSSFSNHTFGISEYITSLVPVDMDNDGDNEIIFGDYNGVIHIYLIMLF